MTEARFATITYAAVKGIAREREREREREKERERGKMMTPIFRPQVGDGCTYAI